MRGFGITKYQFTHHPTQLNVEYRVSEWEEKTFPGLIEDKKKRALEKLKQMINEGKENGEKSF